MDMERPGRCYPAGDMRVSRARYLRYPLVPLQLPGVYGILPIPHLKQSPLLLTESYPVGLRHIEVGPGDIPADLRPGFCHPPLTLGACRT